MELTVIRNKAQLQAFKDNLDQKRLPLKLAVQQIHPGRTVDANDYLWAVVYVTIAEATGSDKDSVHEAYKMKYNFGHEFFYNKKMDRYGVKYGTKSTAGLDMVEFWDYIFKVRADAEISGIVIPMPNEVFSNELNFEKE